MATRRIGGSFAPPLTDERLAEYRKLIDGLDDSPVKDAMTELLTCCEAWRELPESKGVGTRHPLGPTVVPLDAEIAKALWEKIPWREELEMMGVLFGKIPQGELRNAAHHLLWFGVELEQDREPLTNDRL